MHDWCAALFWLCGFPFKRVQLWPSVPTATIACCFSMNDCVYGKKTGRFCSKFRRDKSIFAWTIGGTFFRFFLIRALRWLPLPMTTTTCIVSTKVFLLAIVWLNLWRQFTRAVSGASVPLHHADVNNISHDSCDIMCLIYANMFTHLLLLSPAECCWSWWWVSSFHEVSSVAVKMLASWWCHWLVQNWPLLSHCCTDTPNQQCRNDFILSKSNILNIFGLGFCWGTWIDWIQWFCWWHILTVQKGWTYRMARCCILRSVVQEPLTVRCWIRWVVTDNVVCLLPNVGLFGTDTYSVVLLLYI
jgi:hypothetical protein